MLISGCNNHAPISKCASLTISYLYKNIEHSLTHLSIRNTTLAINFAKYIVCFCSLYRPNYFFFLKQTVQIIQISNYFT